MVSKFKVLLLVIFSFSITYICFKLSVKCVLHDPKCKLNLNPAEVILSVSREKERECLLYNIVNIQTDNNCCCILLIFYKLVQNRMHINFI